MAIPTIVMGLGPVGRCIANEVFKTQELELVGGLEKDENLIGKPLKDLIDHKGTKLVVGSDFASILPKMKKAIVLHATGSRLSDVYSQILPIIEAGISVVSTCPELAYPWLDHAEMANNLDQAARKSGAAILATGINPGFALDRLVYSAGLVSGNIRSVLAQRGVDISNRRTALLNKAGVGLSETEFLSQQRARTIGHIGLNQSAALVALGLGLEYDAIEENLKPVIAQRNWEAQIPIKAGQIAGYRQTAIALKAGSELIKLDLTYAFGTTNSDSILIDADPEIKLLVQGGVSGDLATAWSIINAAPWAMHSGTGLLTVLDLPNTRYRDVTHNR